MMQATKRAAPRASVIFVNWVRPDWLRYWAGSAQNAATRAAARHFGADVVETAHLIGGNRSAWFAWSARNQIDHHPSLAGHKLIGSLVAAYLLERLAAVGSPLGIEKRSRPGDVPSNWRDLTSSDIRGRRHDEALTEDALIKLSLRGGSSFGSELCYQRADQLPILKQSGAWSLRDEGGSKGVEKMGYVSTTIGDSMELSAALPMTSGEECAADVKVRLGYFMTSRPGQGALNITCPGCGGCRGTISLFYRQYNPFPTVQTDATINGAEVGSCQMLKPRETQRSEASCVPTDPGLQLRSISVTGTTSFAILASQSTIAGCRIRVEHVASSHPRANVSRVRVDSITMYPFSNRTVPCPPAPRRTAERKVR